MKRWTQEDARIQSDLAFAFTALFLFVSVCAALADKILLANLLAIVAASFMGYAFGLKENIEAIHGDTS